MAYRINWFKEEGVANAEDGNKIDMNWDEYFALAKKLKAKGRPFGQALGHSTGDPPGYCYPYMWANGSMEVDKDGKTVIFNQPAFVDAMQRFIQAWKDGYDETGTSWDDSSNNRAYLSGQISSTFNGSSIYFVAKKNHPEIAQDTHHMLIPKGPSGRFYWLETRTMAIFKNSNNIPAAKEFLKWWFEDKQFGDWWRIQEGYQLQPVKKILHRSGLVQGPQALSLPRTAEVRVEYGVWPGRRMINRHLPWSKYIIVDTFAKAVQSGDAKGVGRVGCRAG